MSGGHPITMSVVVLWMKRCVPCPGNDDVSNTHPVAELLFGDGNSFFMGERHGDNETVILTVVSTVFWPWRR